MNVGCSILILTRLDSADATRHDYNESFIKRRYGQVNLYIKFNYYQFRQTLSHPYVY